jgi:hypothetical protein
MRMRGPYAARQQVVIDLVGFLRGEGDECLMEALRTAEITLP